MRQQDAAAEASARLRALAGLLGVAEEGSGARALAGEADARLAALLQARGGGGGGAPRAAGEPVLSRGDLSEAQVRRGDARQPDGPGRGPRKARMLCLMNRCAICPSGCESGFPSLCMGTRQCAIVRCSSVAAHQSPPFAAGEGIRACWHALSSLFGISANADAAAL